MLIHASTAFNLPFWKVQELSDCLCAHISCFTIPLVCVNTIKFLENDPPPYTTALEGFNQLYYSHIEMEYEEQPQRNMTVQYNLFKQKKQYVQYESIHC